MGLFSKLSIHFKILAIVIGGVSGLTVTLIFNYNSSNQNKIILAQVRDAYFPVLERLDTNLVRLDKIQEIYTNAVISAEEEMLEEIVVLHETTVQILGEVAVLDRENEDTVERTLHDLAAYIQAANVLSLGMIRETLSFDVQQPMLKKMNEQQRLVQEDMRSFRSHAYQRFIDAIDAANETAAKALVMGVSIAVLMALVLVIAGVWIGNSITNNIAVVVRSLKEMAEGEGDLATRLQSNSCDEIGALVEGFNVFIAKIQRVIVDVSGSTNHVAEAANEMKRISHMSTLGMNAQQQEIQQVVTAMAEMTRSVDSVSESANRAANMAHGARTEAQNGKSVVEENMEAIDRLASEVEHAAEVIKELNSQSESIGKILNVIREIAEQTNLLALNAAIEAARAGEQGRGFAVVADEVRTLAIRTHESTREINDMISYLQAGAQNAVQTMKQGREQAQVSVENAIRVRASLDSIVQEVESISEMNVKIASAAEEQSLVTKEINNNIVNLGQVVIQVAEGARVAENGSTNVATLAGQLKRQVSVFKI